MKKFLLALRFLTAIRLPGMPEQIDPAEMGRSTGYFPIVGLVIGLILAAVAWLLDKILPGSVVNVLLIVLSVVLTGGMHIDGFIDTCDGIGGQKPVEERWRIMHESRVGAFGVAGAALLLLVKFVALNSIPAGFIIPVVVIMPVVGRWAMVFSVLAYPYARPAGMGKVFKEGTTWRQFLAATLITLAVVLVTLYLAKLSFFYITALALIFSILLVTISLANYLKNKFAGLTGDNYGAINEITEVFVLILMSLVFYNHWF